MDRGGKYPLKNQDGGEGTLLKDRKLGALLESNTAGGIWHQRDPILAETFFYDLSKNAYKWHEKLHYV